MTPVEPDRRATISVDVDPIDIHLTGYGHRGLDHDRLVYTVAVPRLLDMFAETGVRATFFVVGRDAGVESSVLRSIAEAGHEVASHSATHRDRFSRTAPMERDLELRGSRIAIEQAVGHSVVGFRAPNWDMTTAMLDDLAHTGYRYDASIMPTLLQPVARVALTVKSRRPSQLRAASLFPASGARLPTTRPNGGEPFKVFPISTSPRIRMPIYHTLRYGMSDARFAAHLDGFRERGEPFFYPLHAVDVLGLEEDRVDSRLAAHPGMGLSRDGKASLLRSSLRDIASRFHTVPYAERGS